MDEEREPQGSNPATWVGVQRPGAGGRALAGLSPWAAFVPDQADPSLQGTSLPNAASPGSGRGGCVGPGGPSRGLPAHEAWRWLLLSARHPEGPPKPWLPATTSARGEVGGAHRADLLRLQRLGLHPRRGVGAMTRINGLGPGLGQEDLWSTCSRKKPGRCMQRARPPGRRRGAGACSPAACSLV